MIRLYTFLIFVAISTVVLYVVFIIPQSDFVGKTSLLIIPKTTIIASNADNTVNDIVFIANEAVAYNIDVQSYGAVVDVRRLKSHDIVQIVVQTKAENDVAFIEKSVLKSVVSGIEKYYTINADFSIKIIQTQVAQKNIIVQIASYILMIAVAIGLIAGVLALSYMVNLVRQRNEYEDNINGEKIFAGYHVDKIDKNINISESEDVNYKGEKVDDDYVSEQPDEEDDLTVEKEITQSEQREESAVGVESQMNDMSLTSISAPDGLSTTPGNLPIIDASDFGLDNTSEITTNENKDLGIDDGEPTEEELKARLNELLNGKL